MKELTNIMNYKLFGYAMKFYNDALDLKKCL